MTGPSASIILTTYNRAHMVLRALKSVLAQLRPGDEFIVVDDGSTDETPQVLRPYLDRIRYVRHSNRGYAVSVNEGLQRAKNPLVGLMDDDDCWMPNKLELQRRIMDVYPQVIYSFTSYTRHYSKGTRRPGCLVDDGPVFEGWKARVGPGIPYSSLAALPRGQLDFKVFIGSDYPDQLKADYMLGALALFRRDLTGPHLRLAEDLKYCQDREVLARLSGLGPVAYLDLDLYSWHEHAGPRFADLPLLEQAEARMAILQRVWGKDEAFLEEHQGEYLRQLDKERTLMVREYLAMGDMQSARRELELLAFRSPFAYRLLARLPSGVVKAARALKRGPQGFGAPPAGRG